jgi:hypothetical protein
MGRNGTLGDDERESKCIVPNGCFSAGQLADTESLFLETGELSPDRAKESQARLGLTD